MDNVGHFEPRGSAAQRTAAPHPWTRCVAMGDSFTEGVGDPEPRSPGGWRGWAGEILIGYALAYPAVSLASQHAYPALPLFNVPCPTAILTLGVLLAARERRWWLSTVPIIWSAIGGSAALLFGMTVDYPLLAAGLVAGIGLAIPRRAPRVTAPCDTARSPA